jgi:2-dehydro-3-deoxygalactonokinase
MRWTEGFIAVDWGTTNRRAYRLDGSGHCVEEFDDDKGALAVSGGGFPAAIAEIRERLGDYPLLLAGMIGSNRGWQDAGYVSAPAGIDELVAALVWPGDREAIVPGLIDPDGLVCHPGTHNKWVTMRGGKINGFRTVMTGELFSLLKEHSILSDLLQGEVEPNDVFKEAARYAIYNEALPADLFSVRARVILGQARKEDAASYASGLLIGSDVRIGLSLPTGAQVTAVGRPDLTKLYAAAIGEASRDAVELDGEQCFLAGAQEIAKRM